MKGSSFIIPAQFEKACVSKNYVFSNTPDSLEEAKEARQTLEQSIVGLVDNIVRESIISADNGERRTLDVADLNIAKRRIKTIS
jgi:hypothetical protein